jgi:hypothetical protein
LIICYDQQRDECKWERGRSGSHGHGRQADRIDAGISQQQRKQQHHEVAQVEERRVPWPPVFAPIPAEILADRVGPAQRSFQAGSHRNGKGADDKQRPANATQT